MFSDLFVKASKIVYNMEMLKNRETGSGSFRLVKLEGLSPSILWCPKGGGVRGGGVEFETGGLDSELGELSPH